MITPNSDQNIPGFEQTEEDLYEPANSEDTSTDSNVDDYKDMQLEIHRFVKRQKSLYNWDNLK
ncbi:hypothetical protein [Candidatus Neptunichlamydia sp. REUL1]|uniref:hypothetical protein n=1 Tax=Candidatus Neptunichlamydia sp. REUL1 TaxID=3064277 RepID=UPI00292CF7B1|nr:hypothetical protein [Candidatus Neptunochlamydia sp. REUL1]